MKTKQAQELQNGDVIQLVRDIHNGKKVDPHFVQYTVTEKPVIGDHQVSASLRREGQKHPKVYTLPKLQSVALA